MDISSNIALTNRSIIQFEEMIEEITACSDINKQLRMKVWTLQKHILNNKHNGQTVEYVLTNTHGYWIERLTLKEEPFEAAALMIAICDMERSTTNNTKYNTISEIRNFIDNIKNSNDYTNVLFSEVTIEFILNCSEYLNNTHNFEIKIVQDMLYFEAIPRGKGTSVIVISQSDSAILLRNIDILNQLADDDYEEESISINKVH